MIGFSNVVESLEELRSIVEAPPAGARTFLKERPALDAHSRAFIAHSPLLLMATAGADGRCDVSPKGDAPGFVQVLDEHRLAIPDRPGNRRLDGMQNLLTNPHVGLLFFVPGRDETLRVNLSGVFHCTRAAVESLLQFPFARVVNVASTAGLIGYPHVAAYCAAKHGVIGFTRALALELARTQVTVNAVCPGYADTAIATEAIANIARGTGRSEAQAREVLERRNPQRRLIAPDEVAATVAWLCQPESQSINGQAISLSGGEVMTG